MLEANGRKSYNLVKSHELISYFIRLYLVPLPPYSVETNYQHCDMADNTLRSLVLTDLQSYNSWMDFTLWLIIDETLLQSKKKSAKFVPD